MVGGGDGTPRWGRRRAEADAHTGWGQVGQKGHAGSAVTKPVCRVAARSKVAHRKNFRTVKKFTNFEYKKYNEMLVSKSRTQKSKLNTKQVETHLSTVIIQ